MYKEFNYLFKENGTIDFPEYPDIYYQIEKEYFYRKINDNHALSLFPKAVSTVKNLIKESKRELEFLLEKEWDIKNSQEPDEIMIIYRQIDIPRQSLVSKLERLEKQLKWADFKPQDDNRNLERAKEYPITLLLEFNKAGFASCPFHNEKTSSLHYIKKSNRVYCFGCQYSGDSIDIAMKLNNCSLREAIKQLAGNV